MNAREVHSPSGRAGLFKRVWKNRMLYLMLLIPLVILILFRYVPMYGVQIAFRNYQPSRSIWESEWVGLKYVFNFFHSYNFWNIITNTLVLGLYGIATFPCALILAICVNYLRNKKFQKFVQTVSYLPHFITMVVMCSIILQLFDAKTGLFNALMGLFGVPARNYMGIPSAFKHIYIWTSVWQDIGYASIIYIAALANTDPELHEAAEVDGASRFQRVIHIDLPTILPTASILLIMNCGNIMNVGFEKAFLMQNNVNMETSEVISTYVYKVGLGNTVTDFSYATAIGLFNSIINLIMIIVVNTITKRLNGNSLF